MKRTESLEVGVPQERALEACRAAFAAMGWEIVEAEGTRLAAIEVPFRLPCRRLPAEVEISAHSRSRERTILAIEGTMAGVGTERELAGYMAAVVKRIRARLS